jgi:hypothetical protein
MLKVSCQNAQEYFWLSFALAGPRPEVLMNPYMPSNIGKQSTQVADRIFIKTPLRHSLIEGQVLVVSEIKHDRAS